MSKTQPAREKPQSATEMFQEMTEGCDYQTAIITESFLDTLTQEPGQRRAPGGSDHRGRHQLSTSETVERHPTDRAQLEEPQSNAAPLPDLQPPGDATSQSDQLPRRARAAHAAPTFPGKDFTKWT